MPVHQLGSGTWGVAAVGSQRVSSSKVTQHTDLGEVMDVLGQHRRDEAHRRHRLSPVGGPRFEQRFVAQAGNGGDEIVLRGTQPLEPRAEATRYVGVVEVRPREVEGELPIDVGPGGQMNHTPGDRRRRQWFRRRPRVLTDELAGAPTPHGRPAPANRPAR